MPFYLHAIADAPETGQPFERKEDALAARQDGQTVTRVLTVDERASWRAREQARFDDGEYTPVPWAEAVACNEARLGWDYESLPGARACAERPFCYLHRRDQHLRDEIRERMRDHFAHISLNNPGMIAYTPDEAHGADDRQVRVKPGRYLQQFASTLFGESDIARYVAQVKAASGELKLARTADEIARVYTANNGPTSCMDRRHFSFSSTPVRVYGDSDLAVAYLGTLADDRDDDVIAARCIVWPERKLFGRAYGDTATLQAVLRTHGYTHGEMDGARVHAIEHDGDYLMPYIDGISTCSLDGDWFVLDDSGDFDCQRTDGRTSSPHGDCSNCGGRCDSDETYCESCENDRQTCGRCGEDYFDSNAGEYFEARGEWMCRECIRNASHDCEVCGDRVCEFDFTRQERISRDMHLCADCHDDHDTCTECQTYYPTDELREMRDGRYCADCRPVRVIRPRGRILRRHSATEDVRAVQAPITLTSTLGGTQDIREYVEVSPALIVHMDPFNSRTWTITHRGTLRAVKTDIPSQDTALHLARRMADLDWTFTDVSTMPRETKLRAQEIITAYA